LKHTAATSTFLCPVCCCLTPEQGFCHLFLLLQAERLFLPVWGTADFQWLPFWFFLFVLPVSCHCRALWRLLFLHFHFHSLSLELWEAAISGALANQLKVLARRWCRSQADTCFWKNAQLSLSICPWIPQRQQGSVCFPHVVTICGSLNIFKFYSAQ